MTERVKITITPSVSDSNLLTVEDGMQQVLDYFDLLEAADKSLNEDERIVWRLKQVTMNSPFTVVAEPFGKDPSVNVDFHAFKVKKRLHDGMEAVIKDKDVPAWIENNKHLQNILKRNLNGIGRTDLDLGERLEPVIISHRIADEAYKNLERRKLKQGEDFTHTAHGSLEGKISSVGTFYNSPCFMLKERLTDKEVRCIVKGAFIDKIGTEHSLEEVWKNKRVIVEGLIAYDASGNPINIDVKDIIKVTSKEISLDSILDKNFTNGLSVSEYLKEIRGDDE